MARVILLKYQMIWKEKERERDTHKEIERYIDIERVRVVENEGERGRERV